MSWCAKYVGLPFVLGGRGPTDFDCWGLVGLIYRDELGIEISELPDLVGWNVLKQREAVELEINQNWVDIKEPEDFCAVCIGGQSAHFFHVGVWVKELGRVVHTRENSNCIIESPKQLQTRMMVIKNFYRHKSKGH